MAITAYICEGLALSFAIIAQAACMHSWDNDVVVGVPAGIKEVQSMQHCNTATRFVSLGEE